MAAKVHAVKPAESTTTTAAEDAPKARRGRKPGSAGGTRKSALPSWLFEDLDRIAAAGNVRASSLKKMILERAKSIQVAALDEHRAELTPLGVLTEMHAKQAARIAALAPPAPGAAADPDSDDE